MTMQGGSVRSRYMLSFLLILVPVIAFSVVIFSQSIHTTRQYVNQMTLEQFQNAANDVKGMLKRCAYAVEDTTSLEACFAVKPDGETSINEAMIAVLLEKMEARINADVEVTLYIRGDTDMYTKNAKMLYRDYESQNKAAYDLNEHAFYRTILSATRSSLLRILPREGINPRESLLALLVPVSVRTVARADVIFVFWINAAQIDETFATYLGDSQGDVVIYSTQNPQIYYQSPGSTVTLAGLLHTKGAGLLQMQIDGEDYMLLRSLDGDMDLYYTMTTPASWFYRTLTQLQRTQFILSLLLCLLVIAFAVLLTRFNYAPIRSLYSDITGKSTSPVGKNELDIIRSYFSASAEKQESLEERVSSLSSVAVNQFVNKLVSGRIVDEAAFLRLCDEAEITFAHPYHAVIYMLCPAMEEGALNLLMLQMQGTHIQHGRVVPCELWRESALVALINFSADGDPAARPVEIAGQFQQAFRAAGYEDIRLGVGCVYTQPLKLSDSFFEASAVVRLADLSEGNIYQYETLRVRSKEAAGSHGLPRVEMSLLEEALHRGERTVALRAIEEITATISESSNSFLVFRFYSAQIISLLTEQAVKNGNPFEHTYLEYLLDYHSSRDLLERVAVAVDWLCEQTADSSRKNDMQQRDELMEHIRQNYHRYDFSIDDVSEHLHMSKAQIISLLRESAGQSFSKYVATLRMNEFKHLLIYTDRTIRELVGAIGYTDVPSFLRKFKQLEGVTPGQYRAAQRQGRP